MYKCRNIATPQTWFYKSNVMRVQTVVLLKDYLLTDV